MKKTNAVLSGGGITIFEVMSRLAVEHGAVNLGQGFPDRNGPDDVRAKAQEYLADQPNQYPSAMGVADLRHAVAAHDKRFYGLDVDPLREVLVTSGATEALASAFFGLLDAGDEAIVFEPVYDSYAPIIQRAGAAIKRIRLEPPHWDIPRADLAAAFSPRTKLIVINSPANPSGKVFSTDELSFIADLVKKFDAYVVCDEVYEHLVFDRHVHTPIMTLPGMRERCLKIGSAGKTFSLTGWKVGYITAAPHLLQAAAKAHQFLTFTTPPNLQRAVAYGLNKDDGYFADLSSAMSRKRDILAAGLRDVGFEVLDTQGTYFICADIRPLKTGLTDVDFCRELTINGKVTAIPISAFYESNGPQHFVRFAFCKDDATLHTAIARLKAYFQR
ncbi:MAG: aminotransferase [Rhodospirillaceae bacterium]|nr:aminotransferase [Rhodospirillaceae bacterium]